jgi:hypothetical protein
MQSVAEASQPISNEKSIDWKRELIVCSLLSLAFGIFICTASNKIYNRQDNYSESVEMERAILRGQPFQNSGRLSYMAPWQNRVFFPALLETGIHIGVFSPSGWYVLLRLLCSIAMFAVLWFALRIYARASYKLAAGGLLLLAYCMFLTFSNRTALTFDFPDAMFTAAFIIASLRRSRVLLLALAIFAATNRESSVFAGVIWFFLYGIDENRKIDFRELAYAVVVSIFSYATVIALRYGFGGAKAVSSNTQYTPYKNNFYQIRDFISHPALFSWVGLIFSMAISCSFLLIANRQYLTSIQKRMLSAAGAIAAVSAVFGNIGDTRIFIPTIVLTIFVAIGTEAISRTVGYSDPVLASDTAVS